MCFTTANNSSHNTPINYFLSDIAARGNANNHTPKDKYALGGYVPLWQCCVAIYAI